VDLFSFDSSLNLLPCDGVTNYYGAILDEQKSDHYLKYLLHNIKWKHDEVILYGKHIITKRKVAWYGDSDFAYDYSNTTKHALPWTTELLELKAIIEKISNVKFNSCLLNLYHDGMEGMAWHSDNEKSMGSSPTIASLSLGAERKFSFKHKTANQTVSLILESGSLLLMQGETQKHWLHSLPKTKKIDSPRVNLTFRTFIEP